MSGQVEMPSDESVCVFLDRSRRGAARMRPESGTVINIMFSTTTTKKVCSCVGISTAIK